jgi:hypothetical protein
MDDHDVGEPEVGIDFPEKRLQRLDAAGGGPIAQTGVSTGVTAAASSFALDIVTSAVRRTQVLAKDPKAVEG